MGDDQNNINLLPDDLRGQESKLQSSNNGSVPVNFHIPQEPKKYIPPTPPQSPQPSLKNGNLQPQNVEIKPLKSALPQKFKPQPKADKPITQVKQKKGLGFLAKLFGKQKKIENLPAGISKVAPTRSLSELNSASLAINNFLPSTESTQKNKETSSSLANGQEQSSFTTEMDVNLIPEGTYLMSNSKLFKSLIGPIVVSLVIGVLPYVGLIIYHQVLKKQNDQLIADIELGDQTFAQYKALEAEADILVKKIEVSKAIIERHVYWTKVFQILEGLTTKDVYYKSIAANVNGTITLTAVANSYTSVAKQYLVYQQATDKIDQVKITGAQGSTEDGEVGFNVILQLQPSVFYSLGSG